MRSIKNWFLVAMLLFSTSVVATTQGISGFADAEASQTDDPSYTLNAAMDWLEGRGYKILGFGQNWIHLLGFMNGNDLVDFTTYMLEEHNTFVVAEAGHNGTIIKLSGGWSG